MGGGVAVLIRNQIAAVSLDDTAELECLCIMLSFCSQMFILYALYRPPDAAPEFLAKLQVHMHQH